MRLPFGCLALAAALAWAGPVPAADDVTSADLIAALSAESEALAAVEGVEPEKVRVVRADAVLPGGNMRALEQALDRDDRQVRALREAIRRNPALHGALEQRGVAVDSVIAVEVRDDGLVVFTRGG